MKLYLKDRRNVATLFENDGHGDGGSFSGDDEDEDGDNQHEDDEDEDGEDDGDDDDNDDPFTVLGDAATSFNGAVIDES